MSSIRWCGENIKMIKNILITGANGFIGKHACEVLNREGYNIFKYDLSSSEDELNKYIDEADIIIHLAGINRPMSVEEFYDGNSNFTKHIVDLIKQKNKNTPIIMSSSIQAVLDNDYGKSKKMGEDYLFKSGLPVYIYRLANVFGSGCRPNYNSVCATFCFNIAHNLDIQIRDKDYIVHFNYVDDVVDEFLKVIKKDEHNGVKDILYVSPTHDCSLGKLADLLYYFKQEIESDRHLPLLHCEFELKLFKTFCSYLTEDGYTYNFAKDERGYFQELYKSKKYGQISDNVSYPNIVKGGHYHTYKQEIFYTVIGKCEIIQQNIKTGEIIKDIVDGDSPNPIHIKVGYTHQIKNIGQGLSHTIMWISQIYDPKTHDTYKQEIKL